MTDSTNNTGPEAAATPEAGAAPDPDPKAAEPGAEAAEPDDTDGEQSDASRASREAARYRTRLREAEQRGTEMESRLTGYQTREAERLAAASLSRPEDLWLDGVGMDELLDDDGQVDAEAVATAVAAVLQGRERLAKPGADFGGGQRGNSASGGGGWGDLLKNR